jgi:cbb3-type cytochrome oxidase subunit 3
LSKNNHYSDLLDLPLKTKNNTDDNNGDFPLFAVFFIGVIIWIILRPKKNKTSNNLSKKSKLDLIEEWKNNRK